MLLRKFDVDHNRHMVTGKDNGRQRGMRRQNFLRWEWRDMGHPEVVALDEDVVEGVLEIFLRGRKGVS